MQDPKELKEKIKALYQRHINAPASAAAAEEDVSSEYARQRDYLERTVRSLKTKLDKDTQLHRTDNLRIMQARHFSDIVTLISYRAVSCSDQCCASACAMLPLLV